MSYFGGLSLTGLPNRLLSLLPLLTSLRQDISTQLFTSPILHSNPPRRVEGVVLANTGGGLERSESVGRKRAASGKSEGSSILISKHLVNMGIVDNNSPKPNKISMTSLDTHAPNNPNNPNNSSTPSSSKAKMNNKFSDPTAVGRSLGNIGNNMGNMGIGSGLIRSHSYSKSHHNVSASDGVQGGSLTTEGGEEEEDALVVPPLGLRSGISGLGHIPEHSHTVHFSDPTFVITSNHHLSTPTLTLAGSENKQSGGEGLLLAVTSGPAAVHNPSEVTRDLDIMLQLSHNNTHRSLLETDPSQASTVGSENGSFHLSPQQAQGYVKGYYTSRVLMSKYPLLVDRDQTLKAGSENNLLSSVSNLPLPPSLILKSTVGNPGLSGRQFGGKKRGSIRLLSGIFKNQTWDHQDILADLQTPAEDTLSCTHSLNGLSPHLKLPGPRSSYSSGCVGIGERSSSNPYLNRGGKGGDGWKLRAPLCIRQVLPKIHQSYHAITCIKRHPDRAGYFLSGTKDGRVSLWSTSYLSNIYNTHISTITLTPLIKPSLPKRYPQKDKPENLV